MTRKVHSPLRNLKSVGMTMSTGFKEQGLSITCIFEYLLFLCTKHFIN